ncbi:sacsin N-terminal ATP-binding-like domain-containing protein [Chloroflexota bacterium]
MVSNYTSIRKENERRYGTDIGRIGPMLLADRYADRTHFIFELIQNAEDSLARRGGWKGKRSISFELSKTQLQVSHFGIPFIEPDVRGICGIGESTKDITSIGRFGIGFKSVYAFTDRPEVHSGYENFAINCFVWPEAVPPIGTNLDETTFILPFRTGDILAGEEIRNGLRGLGPRTLLFLREIEDISWADEDGTSGFYFRGKPEAFGDTGRKVTITGEERGVELSVEETWIIFSHEVVAPDGKRVGYIEIAWQLTDSGSGVQTVNPIDDSRLVAFFPTIVPTNLGFLLQGPYRTTPSRDNVPPGDPWNKSLVQESAELLLKALHELRKMNILNADALRSLPLDRVKFSTGSMFMPLFEAVRSALISQPLLPRYGGDHVSAASAQLARTQDLRELFTPAQLGSIFQVEGEIFWLGEEITLDRAPELRRYFMQELDVTEITPDTILPMLTQDFLENQPDIWIVKLYEFLNSQPGLIKQNRLAAVPIIRIEDGRHVTPRVNGQPQAFLPSLVPTDFPTVRRAVCETEEAKALFSALGITQQDPVDDVIRNVLPRYQLMGPTTPSNYQGDIKRILNAFRTDSKNRRDSLIRALSHCPFVAAIDAGSRIQCFSAPDKLYIATDRLTTLFEGVDGVLIVDDTYECLHGEDIRELLEASGASRYLTSVAVETNPSRDQLLEMRRKAGCEDCTYNESIDDQTLRGLESLLYFIQNLEHVRAIERARLLWDALCDVQDRRGSNAFLGTYIWKYLYLRSWKFDAYFLRLLNEIAWVPDQNGKLRLPGLVVFQDTGWKENPFLQSKIHFRPPAIDALAREAGIEPGVLELLNKLGVTSEKELKTRLGITDEPTHTIEESIPDFLAPDQEVKLSSEQVSEPTYPIEETPDVVRIKSGANEGPNVGDGSEKSNSSFGSNDHPTADSIPLNGYQRTTGSKKERRFVSYVGANPDNEDQDPDGLKHEQRIVLEEKAIAFVLKKEPNLQRTPTNNPGFDLMGLGLNGQLVRRVEVKAMTGDLTERPVGLSHTQFDCAREHQDAYWLYVVEKADDPIRARILRIQNPAGKAQTFTFDHGWLNVAEIVGLADSKLQAHEK